LGAYRLVAVGRSKRFGTRGEPPVALASATYDPVAHTVTLTTRRHVPDRALQLSIATSGILDAEGRPIVHNGGGPPGGEIVATLVSPRFRRSRASRPSPVQRITMAVFQMLLGAGRLSSDPSSL
jgi:hypothetical protein